MDGQLSNPETDVSRGTSADRAALLIAVPSASVAFMLAFNLGAFDTIFFDAVFSVWVVSTLVLVGSLVSRLPPQHLGGRLILFVPSLWFFAAWVTDPADDDTASNVLFASTIFVTVVCLPFIAWMLISIINPEFVDLPGKNKLAVLGAVILFASIGYLVGVRNDVFLTCDEFKLSGNDLPDNCTPLHETPSPEP
jgi:hypothetical protein